MNCVPRLSDRMPHVSSVCVCVCFLSWDTEAICFITADLTIQLSLAYLYRQSEKKLCRLSQTEGIYFYSWHIDFSTWLSARILFYNQVLAKMVQEIWEIWVAVVKNILMALGNVHGLSLLFSKVNEISSISLQMWLSATQCWARRFKTSPPVIQYMNSYIASHFYIFQAAVSIMQLLIIVKKNSFVLY